MKKNYLYSLIFLTLFLNAEAQQFTEISSIAGLNYSSEQLYDTGGGVCVFDFNNDGFEDFFLPGGWGTSALFKNNGDGTFTDVLSSVTDLNTFTLLDSLLVTSSIAGDIDNDGDKDLFITTSGYKVQNGVIRQPDILLENLGNGNFANISQSAGINSISYSEAATMGDYNMDGFLDIYVGNYVHNMSYVYDSLGNPIAFLPSCLENFFYINNGNKTFTESASLYGMNNSGCALSASFTDFDFDHDVDILLANDFGEFNTYPNEIYLNNYPTDNFIPSGNASGFNRSMFGMGIAPGDFNEDGHLDYYITNIGTNSFYVNNGNGTFSDQAIALGIDMTWGVQDSLKKTSWGCNFFDYDNDTHQDLFVATGYVAAFMPLTIIKDSSMLFRNNGSGTFVNVTASSGINSVIADRGSAVFDFDNDGDMDIIVNHNRMQIYNNMSISQNLHLYRNDNSNNNNWLKIKLIGTRNNHDAYGSRVIVYVDGRKFIREIDGGSSHASLNSSIAHFGLGAYTTADSVEVHWLGSGVQTVYNVNSNQTLTLTEPVGLSTISLQSVKDINVFPNPIKQNEDFQIRIFSEKETNLQIVMEDQLGRQLFDNDVMIQTGTLLLQSSDFGLLPKGAGIYYLRFYENGHNILNKKIIIR